MPRWELQFQQEPPRDLLSSWGSGQMAMSSLGANTNPNKTPAEKGAQLSVASLIRQIATEWPSYHRKGRVDKTDPVYTLVTVDLPKALIPYVANYDNIILEGSRGIYRSWQHNCCTVDRPFRSSRHHECHVRLLRGLSLLD